eukprot:TRINITY_DN29858_c0_g1_i1.p1 TRINITY_DN29858_c0_g1~~TRINITY_DN29858_c0_g1_i1.p1  ORF type:complete len:122 (+),score=8.57 TRINITY_DN29858_c0_g1_i1:59-424(+)
MHRTSELADTSRRIVPRDLLAPTALRKPRKRRCNQLDLDVLEATQSIRSNPGARDSPAQNIGRPNEYPWNEYNDRVLEPLSVCLASPNSTTRSPARARSAKNIYHGTDFTPHYLWCSGSEM